MRVKHLFPFLYYGLLVVAAWHHRLFLCRVNDAIAKCAQETIEEAKKTGQHVDKDKATADQWSRATNIIHVMAAVIYKKLFR